MDSYVLVLAGLLLTMSSLGDRFGRKRALQVGLVVFGLSSAFAAYSQSGGRLITARAAMGIGVALIMPATLAIIVDVFPREESGRAIGIWTAPAALGMPIGPLLGGYLQENFWWGSVFLINVPIVLIALAAGLFLVPDSRNPNSPRIDIPGAALSTAALSILVFAVIEGPAIGWLDPSTVSLFAGAVILGAVFVVYELRTERPMLSVRLFRNGGFSAGSGALAVSFMALVGMAFVLTQYLQVVRDYSPFDAGARIVPLAIGLMIGAANSNRLVARLGPRIVVVLGLTVIAFMLIFLSLLGLDTPYLVIGLSLFFFGFGIGNVMAPAAASVMRAVPAANAGVGSAFGTVSRQVGVALGVGILGSTVTSVYSSKVAGALGGLSAEASVAARNSVGAAAQIASSIGGPSGDSLRSAANRAFVDGFGVAMLVEAGIVLAVAALVLAFMPSREVAGLREESEMAGPSSVPAHGDD